MNTKIVGNFDKFTNRFTTFGKVKNEIYKKMESHGIKEIRERSYPDSRAVILGHIPEKSLSDITIGVDLNKGYVAKQTTNNPSFLGVNSKIKTLAKVFMNIKEKPKKSVYSIRKYVNENLVGKLSVFKKSTDRTKRVAKFGEMTKNSEIKSYVKSTSANGDSFVYLEKKDGSKIFKKNLHQKNYQFTNKKD